MTGLFWAILAALVLVAALRLRGRIRRPLGSSNRLDDEAIRRIEEVGSLELDAELDLEEIEEQERRFLEEEEWE